MDHSILFIRETQEQITGSDCCGVLRGEFNRENGLPLFQDTLEKNKILNELGDYLYQKYHPGFEIKYIDPRNQMYLIPKLIKDVFIYKPSFKDSLKTIFQFFNCPAIIVNGCVINYKSFSSNSEIEKYIKD